MPDPEPTQLEKLKTKRLWLLYAAILCSLLVALTFWLERDSEDIYNQATDIEVKIDSLSNRVFNLMQMQSQLMEEISGINEDERDNLTEAQLDNLPDEFQEKLAAIEAEDDQITHEIERLKSEIGSLRARHSSTAQSKQSTIVLFILVGLQAIFLIAYLKSPRGSALNGSESDSAAHGNSPLT